jgi:hypothetical protein
VDYHTSDQGAPLKSATPSSGVITQPLSSKQVVHTTHASRDIIDRIVGVGSMEDRGGGQNLNRTAGVAQPEGKIMILGRERGQPPSPYIIKWLTGDHDGAGTVTEPSVPL